MADNNLGGIQFNLGNLPRVATPIGLAQQSVGATPHTLPNTTTPLSDPVAAGVAGIEKGAEVAGASAVGSFASRLGFKNDVSAVGQQLIQNRFADATVEAVGVAGSAGGAAVGTKLLEVALDGVAVNPVARVATTIVSAGVGAYYGADLGKSTTLAAINALDVTAPLAAGATVTPLATLPNGAKYGLGMTVDGKLDWYAISDNSSLVSPSAYTPLPIALRQQLTDSFAQASMSAEDFAKYNQYVTEIKTYGDTVDNINSRIKPVGEVAFAASDSDSSGAAAVTSEKPTVFNPATALPSYNGDNAVTVQPGDTVSSIAKRYDMTVEEFSAYLKTQYAEGTDLNSIVAGSKLPLPPDVYERTSGGVNGLDLPPENSPLTPEAKEVNDALVDAFSNPQIPSDKGVQIADTSGDLPDTSAHANTNTLNNYLDTQGNALSTQQQDALATQIDKLGLGGEGDLSFYSLPNGGALIANADGDIVGEIHLSNSGDVNIKAHAIDENGNTVEVNQHINAQGESLNQAKYNAQAQAQANASVDLFNSLMATQQWAQLDDMGKLAVLANVYSAVDTLSGNLPGDVGGLASVLSLMQGLDSGNDMLALRSGLQLGAMGLSAYSDYMADVALQMANDMMASSAVDAASSAAMDAAAEAALESAAASNAVPYVNDAANDELFRRVA